jgi:hypothetical protein
VASGTGEAVHPYLLFLYIIAQFEENDNENLRPLQVDRKRKSRHNQNREEAV